MKDKTNKSKSLLPVAPSKSISPTTTDPLLSTYMREIQKYPLLTREEEHELALDYFKNKNIQALQKLVSSNLRFVVKIAYEYIHYRIKLLDLIQEGNTGLVKAVQDFDPYKEVRLTTYAVWWIRSYIQDSILKNYSLVKMGTTQAQKKLFYRLRQEQRKLEQMGLRPTDVKLLAARLDVKEKEVEEMDQRLSGNDLSLNAPMRPDEKNEYMTNLSDHTESADTLLSDSEQLNLFKKTLKEFSKTLGERDKLILESRIISENPMTLQEIGDKYNITKERSRQIEEQIKIKLKEYMKDHFPDYDILSKD